jgi:hypothetical protein
VITLDGLPEVLASPGTALGPTEWVEITQDRLDAFAAACPGAPVGWLLLSMTNLFMPEMVTVTGVSAGLNVGTGRIRFSTDPIPAGTKVRTSATIESADEVKPGAVQTVIHIRVESDSAPHPLLEVEALSRWLE